MSDKTWGIMASVQAEIELHKIEIVLVRMNMAAYMDFVELWKTFELQNELQTNFLEYASRSSSSNPNLLSIT